MKKRILTIDGNYFAMRALGTLNIGEKSNNLESIFEKESFTNQLNSALINLYLAFEPFVDNIVFCTDNYSWRKDIEPHKPYWITDDRPIKYKENRKEKKESSSINYDNFYELYREFIGTIKTKMIVFDIKGLEGDDLLMLIANKLTDNKDIEIITFCTDGDLMQIVKNNSLLMRNIRSTDAPFGEFVINYSKYCEIFEQDAKSQLLGNGLSSIDSQFYRSLFSMSLFGNQKVERSLHKGINIATPFKVALLKSICGDKKDNLFSVLGWKSTTGNLEYKITEKHIIKALDRHRYKLTEQVCQQILIDKELLTNLIITLKDICKQPDVPLKQIGIHLKHNLQMNVLNRSNIPVKYVDEFDIMWNSFKDEIFNKNFNISQFKGMDVNKKDSATNILQQSIPDLTSILLG